MPNEEVGLWKLFMSGLKAPAFCLLGIVLGSAYALYGLMRIDDLSGILLAVCAIPGFYYLRAGTEDGLGKYETLWDELLVGIPLAALVYSVGMFFVKAAFGAIKLEWLPDLVICWLIAAACFRRSFLWWSVIRDNERRLKKMKESSSR